jgi:predicted dehydrogenase
MSEISRRNFLGASAALAAAAPEPPLYAANDRIQIGVIGTGARSQEIMQALLEHKNAEIVGVADAYKGRLERALDRVGGRAKAYPTWRDVISDKSIDAVVVATPDHWHKDMVIAAMRAGKDVYCEKPLTLTIAEGATMIKAARQNKRIVQTGSQQRSDKRFRLACELVRSGRLGKIHTVRVGIPKVNFPGPAVPNSDPPKELAYDFWLGPAPQKPYNAKHVHYNFRFFWDYAGGQMTNFGAHDLDIAQWGLGMDESGPVAIEAKARFQENSWYDVPEWCEVTYEYANGVTVICGQGIPGGATFEGEKGTIHVDRKQIESTPSEIVQEPLAANDVHLYESNDHWANWKQCIKSRELPICDVAIGHRSATVCHLGNIAIRTGRRIVWDPAKEQIVGDEAAAAMISRPYRAPWKLRTG